MDVFTLATHLKAAIALAHKHKGLLCISIVCGGGDSKLYHNDLTGYTNFVVHTEDDEKINDMLASLGIDMRGLNWKKVDLDEKFELRFNRHLKALEEPRALREELEETKRELERVKEELRAIKKTE
jgi:hypothetical protein